MNSFAVVLLILGVTCYGGGFIFEGTDGTARKSSRRVWLAFRRVGLAASALGIVVLGATVLVG